MDDKLLRRYIIDKAGRHERRQVIDWIKESPENLERFASLRAKYVFSGFPNSILPEKRRILFPVLTTIAAILSIPLMVLSVWMLVSRNEALSMYADASRQLEVLTEQTSGDVTYVSNPGINSLIVLPDSSTVRLNGSSKLTVPMKFASDTRELFLSGEGYFDIRHHDDWPMTIHTSKGVDVKVLGTTFDLSAYDSDDNVKLTLIEGSVVLKEAGSGREHHIRPLEEIQLPAPVEKTGQEAPAPVIKHADIQKNTAWVKGELVFDNTPMPEIVKQLERWYGVHIHIVDEEVLSYRLTATFTTESITRVLDLIRFSSMLQYDMNGKEVYIRKERR